MGAVHPALAAAFDALDRGGVTWALLRGAHDLAQPEGDVDLLVDAASAAGLDGCLAQVGLARVRAPGRGTHRFYFRWDGNSRSWLKLDVVTDLSFGTHLELRLPNITADLLARRHRSEGVWRLADDDEAWLLLLHLLLDKDGAADDRLAGARRAVASAEGGGLLPSLLDAVAGEAGTARWLLTSREASQPHPPSQEELAHVLRRRRLHIELARARNRLVRRALPARLGRGCVVAVLGPDGAGKTTLALALAEAVPVPASYVYLGLWRPSTLPAALRRLPGVRTATTLSRLGHAVVSIRYLRLRGRLALVDRYVQDAALTDGVDGSAGGRLVALALRMLAPVPDVMLVLDAPAEQMWRRKGEHTVEILDRRRQDYLRLAGSGGAFVVDASRSAAEVCEQALELVWSSVADAQRSLHDRMTAAA